LRISGGNPDYVADELFFDLKSGEPLKLIAILLFSIFA
jgi:hypothetical protein